MKSLIFLGICILALVLVTIYRLYYGWRIKKFKLFFKESINSLSYFVQLIFVMWFAVFLANIVVVVNKWSHDLMLGATTFEARFVYHTFPTVLTVFGIYMMWRFVFRFKGIWFKYSDEEKTWLQQEKEKSKIYQWFNKNKGNKNRVINWIANH